ncbi:PLP-dependent aminotransferase family protein [Secundilactobacillus paracollinoides]|uniref:aminotransferase-like domain-containing protein n=1 Tax=Secundilactobacillus paracollinoides TaxID=240427 RepID=UPI0006D10A68|nr:PLP-dependent aminotransferase family protein [Secundilactobacillus paracollinoides]
MLLIDRNGGEKIYLQLYRQIRAEIETSVRQPGQAMPSTRYLSQELAVSRNTVDHAYQDLVAEGYLVSRPGAGYHVTHHLPFVVEEKPATQRSVHRGAFQYDFTENFDYLRLFPKQAWLSAEERVMSHGIEHIQPVNGDLEYRQQLVTYLNRLKNIDVTPEQIVITSGFNEAASIIARLMPEWRKTTLAVAEPVAPNARDVWTSLNIPTMPFRDWQRLPKTAAYLLAPTHNFPSGEGLSMAQRQELAHKLLADDCYLIELDTDGSLSYSGQAAPAIFHEMGGQNCFYYTNYDETLGSSLCLGVLVLPEALVASFQTTYRHLPNRNSQWQQQILSQLIANDDLERFIRQLTIVYNNRRQLINSLVAETFGDKLTPMGAAAGSFAVFHVNSDATVDHLIDVAGQAGVGW